MTEEKQGGPGESLVLLVVTMKVLRRELDATTATYLALTTTNYLPLTYFTVHLPTSNLDYVTSALTLLPAVGERERPLF